MSYVRLHPEDRALLENLQRLLTRRKREAWVKIGDVKRLTGFSRDTITRYRQMGLLEYKRENAQIFYLYESLLPFIKKETAAGTAVG